LPLLSALLLFAQQVAATHAVWHQTRGMPIQATAVEKAEKSDDGKQHANPLCSFDAMLGQLLAGGAVAAEARIPAKVDGQAFLREVQHLAALPLVQPRSRGPPLFL